MATLKDIRAKIDTIDTKIVKLLDERARLAKQIGERKKKRNIHYFDASRQKRILERVRKATDGSFPTEGIKHVYTEIMSACLNLEQPLEVAYWGPEGTFTHQAAVSEFGSSVLYSSYKSIRDIFTAVEKEWVNYGVVPIENSTGGIVHYTLDMFMEHDLKISSEIIVNIHQNLLSSYRPEDITTIYSHEQALTQCETWLREHLPKADLKEVTTTVAGIELAKKKQHGAAIGSELAARLYGLRIVAGAIEDEKENCTRFLVIGRQDMPPSGEDKTSIMFSAPDRPGALFILLKPFADANLNLSKIESRPTKRKPWEYMFFVDVAGHISNPTLKKAFHHLERQCEFAKVLGSYPRETRVVE